MTTPKKSYRLPTKALVLLVPFILSFAMSCIVSLISTLIGFGLSGFVFGEWFFSWMASWAIAFPSVLILLPIARKIALLFVHPPRQQ